MPNGVYNPLTHYYGYIIDYVSGTFFKVITFYIKWERVHRFNKSVTLNFFSSIYATHHCNVDIKLAFVPVDPYRPPLPINFKFSERL